MNDSYKNIIAGMGSLLVLMPTTDYSRFIPRESTSERISNSFIRVGINLQHASKKINDEQKQK